MDNRQSPDRQWRLSPRKQASSAHKEAEKLESFIVGKRLEYRNITSGGTFERKEANATDNQEAESTRGHFGRFPWELENDLEWTAPFLHSDRWIELPRNQHYSRRDWFSSFNDSQSLSLLQAGNHIRFVFALSTGHCGTTTLSTPIAYEENGFDPNSCYFGFETLAQGIREFSRRHPGRRAARAFVRHFYLPSLINMTVSAGKSCFVDLGHHTLFGHILSALKVELGSRMTTIRLRRSRIDTAMSYAVKRKKDGPCGSRCVYCPCPDEQRSCLSVSAATWRKFTVFMKFLWMIDEIECRWHTFQEDSKQGTEVRVTAANNTHTRQRSQGLFSTEEVEFNWSTELNPHLIRLAQIMEFPRMQKNDKFTPIAASVHKSHVSKKEKISRSPQQNEAEDHAYRKLMKFSHAEIAMLRDVFF